MYTNGFAEKMMVDPFEYQKFEITLALPYEKSREKIQEIFADFDPEFFGFRILSQNGAKLKISANARDFNILNSLANEFIERIGPFTKSD